MTSRSGRPAWPCVVIASIWCVAVLGLMPGPAGAQTLNGVTEWTVARGSDTTGGQTRVSRSFWQNYSISFGSFIVDPRLMKYDAGLTFRTTSLKLGSEQGARRGGQRGLGYHLNASLFPARPFPLSVQMSRNKVDESGDLQSSSLIRGGVVVPAGQPQPDFETRNHSLSVSWQLKTGGLPNIDVGFRKADALTRGGGYEAEQRDQALHVLMSKDTGRTHQGLRFQKTSFEHLLSQAFNQRFSELDYDFGLQLGGRSRFSARAGRRSSYSLFETPAQVVDPGTGIAQLPSQGESATNYATSGITFEPNGRVSLGLTGSVDEQRAAAFTTTSRLLTSTARLEPFAGLSLSASGIYGTRGQVVADVPVTVLTRTVQMGASYRAGVRWLEGSLAGTRRIGENSAQDGRLGRVESWSGDTSLSVSAGWFGITAGYERRHSEDAILDFGNFDVRRRRASVQLLAARLSVTGQWDRSISDRGRGRTFLHAEVDTYSASLSFRWREVQMTASGGGFDSRTTLGQDRTHFVGAAAETRVRKVLLSAALRDERTSASVTGLDQSSLVWFAKAEYTRRLFGFAIEYRRNAQHLQFAQMVVPSEFRGRQFNVRILRKFGVRM